MRKKSFSKVTIVLIFFTLIGRVSGLFREMMLSYIYGASGMSDAYVVATTFSSIIFAGIAAALLNGYIPIAVERKNQETLNKYTNNMLVSTLAISLICAIILIILLKPILSIMTVGFSIDAYNNTIRLSCFTLIFSPLLCGINILVGYLQVKGNFLASTIQSIVTNTIMIFVFLYAYNDISKLGIGFGISLVVPFALNYIIAYKEKFRFIVPERKMSKEVQSTWILIIPTLGVQLAAQINSIIDRSFASTLAEGTVSSLKYAFLICTMVVSVIAVSISMVTYPRIADFFVSKEEKKGIDLFERVISIIMIVVFPIVIGLMVLAKPIIKLIFEHGAFTPENTVITASLLQIYAVSIIGNSLQEIMGRVLLAAKKAKALFVIYTSYVIINIIFNALLVQLLGARGLALGTSVATIIAVIIMLIYIKKTFQLFDISKLMVTVTKSIISGIVMGVSIFLMKNVLIFGKWENSIVGCIVSIACYTVIGALIYILCELLFKEKIIKDILKEHMKDR